MNAPAVSVQGLSKQYLIGASRVPHSNLRESISLALSETWITLQGRRSWRRGPGATIWALKDVSFDVEEGEVLGVIGGNGAGKSTLLKILSRITEPTAGRAFVRGRVASLLEVGSGFHGDLTGRENVILNGAVLGMRREEIRRKFDEIVAFSGVEQFLDTPVKRYSSGMYMRLAFAVAAHLEPEILVVDEVLAVGDAEFQKKCLGKMKEVSGQGRTILFVSHNMGAVSNLCSRCALLEHGELKALGPTRTVVDSYVTGPHSRSVREALGEQAGRSDAWIDDAHIETIEGVASGAVPVDGGFRLVLAVESREELRGVDLDVRVETRNGSAVCTTGARHTNPDFAIRKGRTRFAVAFPGSFLAPGTYYFTIAIHRPNLEFYSLCERLLSVQIVESGSEMWRQGASDFGCVLARLPWEESKEW